MNIVMLTSNDPAGMGCTFTRAINRHTDHSCRLITTEQRYGIDFGKDLHLPDLGRDDYDLLVDLLRDADILHFHMLADETMQLGSIRVADYLRGKGLLHHHHGHPVFRANPREFREKYQRLGRRAIVSTPDLLQLLPEASWQPNIVPIDDPLYTPLEEALSEEEIVIGQSPTRKDLKNCSDLAEAVAVAAAQLDVPLRLRSIEKTQHTECLRLKRECHIMFDHMQGYFGVSSLESLSQGKPVIAGLDDWNIRHIKDFTGRSELPWVIAHTSTSLAEEIVDLARDRVRRQAVGQAARRFMAEVWSEVQVLQPLLRLYGKL